MAKAWQENAGVGTLPGAPGWAGRHGSRIWCHDMLGFFARYSSQIMGAWCLGSNLAHGKNCTKNCIRNEKKIISTTGGPESTNNNNNGKKTRRNSYDKIRERHVLTFYYANLHGFTRSPTWVPCLFNGSCDFRTSPSKASILSSMQKFCFKISLLAILL